MRRENANKFSYDKRHNDITNPTNEITFLISLSFSFLAGVYQINQLIVLRSSYRLIFKRKESTLEFRNFLQKPSKGQAERSFEQIWKCFSTYLKVSLFVTIQKILLMSKEITPWRSGNENRQVINNCAHLKLLHFCNVNMKSRQIYACSKFQSEYP